MQVTRNSIETMTGPSEWFTGAVYVDSVAAPSGTSRLAPEREQRPPISRYRFKGNRCGELRPEVLSDAHGIDRLGSGHFKGRG